MGAVKTMNHVTMFVPNVRNRSTSTMVSSACDPLRSGTRASTSHSARAAASAARECDHRIDQPRVRRGEFRHSGAEQLTDRGIKGNIRLPRRYEAVFPASDGLRVQLRDVRYIARLRAFGRQTAEVICNGTDPETGFVAKFAQALTSWGGGCVRRIIAATTFGGVILFAVSAALRRRRGAPTKLSGGRAPIPGECQECHQPNSIAPCRDHLRGGPPVGALVQAASRASGCRPGTSTSVGVQRQNTTCTVQKQIDTIVRVGRRRRSGAMQGSPAGQADRQRVGWRQRRLRAARHRRAQLEYRCRQI